jgi:hypothetical protein
LEQGGLSLPEDVRLAAGFSDYAVAARYPGPMESVTEEEYREAIALSATVLGWVEQLLGPKQEPASQADEETQNPKGWTNLSEFR